MGTNLVQIQLVMLGFSHVVVDHGWDMLSGRISLKGFDVVGKFGNPWFSEKYRQLRQGIIWNGGNFTIHYELRCVMFGIKASCGPPVSSQDSSARQCLL